MSRRENGAPPSPVASGRKKSRKTLAVLFSCCLFLAIACACLLTALVLIGKHLVYNSTTQMLQRNVEKVPKIAPISRLPKDVVPSRYELVFKPDLDSGKFEGSVSITLNVSNPRKDLVLNSKNLSINAVRLVRIENSKVVEVGNVHENVMEETLVVVLKETLDVGAYKFDLDFSGTLLNKSVGLYRSYYKIDGSDKPRYMATSKFEPTYARQAFPCFDEPNMKATYKVHLLKPDLPDYIALSNNPEDPEAPPEKVDGGVMVHFQETVPMSTYLSCFIVSDFEHTNNSFENNGSVIPFRVYASPGQLEKTTYAGEVGKAVIEFYINYFNIPYPLPKLDMVAIPDFVSGAMEHWGLVTYRETALLYTNLTHSSSNKQRVATVVAHELAHSWFGNLVTMNWWNDLWLNEGFATYIEYKGVDHAENSWGMLDQFLISELHSVLALDATQGSHPIIKTVSTPDQITEVFDTISYNKGASVLRMLESAVGEENFRKGVTNYLNKYEYKNAVTKDLWNEIQDIVGSGLNVTEFMDTFTVQMGFPVLDVAVNGNKYVLTQKRFLIDPETEGTGPTSPLNYKWTIPVTYITDLSKKPEVIWFDKSANSIEVEKPEGAKFLKFNSEQVGYYRVNYPEAEWKTLISFYNNLTVSDRTHLLEESFSIAESGDLSYNVPLDLIKFLTDEIDYVPWSVAYSFLAQISNYLHNTEYETDFREYVVKILQPAYDKFSWDEDESDDHLRRLARVVVLKLACVMKHQEALKDAELKFNEWIDVENATLSQDLRGLIYQYGMLNGDEETWKKLFERFAQETDANEKLKLMNGLSYVQDPTLLSRLIDLAKNNTYVRDQDYFTLLQYIANNPIGRPIVWDYVREHWSTLVERFTLNNRYLGRLIPAITNKFSTVTKLEEMKHFFEKYPDAGAGAGARTQALETVNNNIKWLAKHKTVVENWIVNNKNN